MIKIINIFILVLISVSQLFAQNAEMKKIFTEFQTAILNQDCEKLIEISDFPIEGDVGLIRLITSVSPRSDMGKYNYEISKELLSQKCSLMDSIEVKVLENFSVCNETKNSGTEFNGCIYKSHLYVAEDNNYFQWSVGCIELLEDSIGEYTIVFTFKLIDGEYRLKQIHGAG